MEEYGVAGAALLALAGFTGWLIRYIIGSFTSREERLTTELKASRREFINHLEHGNASQAEANLAVAKQLELLNQAQKEHDDNAQKRHDGSMKVLQEMSTQLSWYRERHDGEVR